MADCAINGCSIKPKARGLCNKHYESARSKGAFGYLGRVKPLSDCYFLGCGHPGSVMGLCKEHRNQQRAGKTMSPVKRLGRAMCEFPDCDRRVIAFGLCSPHYQQRSMGKELTRVITMDERSKLWESIKDDPTCRVHGCNSRISSLRPKRDSRSAHMCSSHVTQSFAARLSAMEYISVMSIQQCESCGLESEGINTDHDHSCPNHQKSKMCRDCIRGRLCRSCNLALGFMRDDPDRIRGLLAYAERNVAGGKRLLPPLDG